MQQMPRIELRIQEFGEQLHAMIAVHHREIEQYLQQGVEQTVSSIGPALIEQAAKEAADAITQELHTYFSYGPGAKAIRAAMQRALAPLTEALRAGQPEDE